MFSIRQDDVLLALKKSMRLAKQDFLAGPMTEDPPYWRAQAEARRQVYIQLANEVSENGVETAFRRASRSYAALPLFDFDRSGGQFRPDPVDLGREKAYEMFFSIIGVPPMKLEHLRNARRRSSRRAVRARTHANEEKGRAGLGV